jgi:hypothetical protein
MVKGNRRIPEIVSPSPTMETEGICTRAQNTEVTTEGIIEMVTGALPEMMRGITVTTNINQV